MPSALLQGADLARASATRSLASRLLERLVEQQHLRLEHDGAGQRHALLLAARELVRLLRLVAREADQLQHVARRRGAISAASRAAARAGRRRRSRTPRDAETARSSGTRSRCRAGWAAMCVTSWPPIKMRARVGLLEAGDHAQRRRLAAARRAEQRQQLARLDVEADVAHGVDLALHACGRSAWRRRRAGCRSDRPCASASRGSCGLRRRPPARAGAPAAALRPVDRRRTRRRSRTPRTPPPGPSDSSVMFSRMRTVISVQPIETRKIVALIAVIERMNTTPRPAKNAGSDQRQRDAAEGRAAAARRGSARPPPGCVSICCSSATVARMPVGL